MVIGLPLPELLASAMKQPVGLTRGSSLERFQQQARRNRRQQKQVDVIRHDYKRSEAIVSQVLAVEERFDYKRGDGFAPQINGTRVRSVEAAIHPRKSRAIGSFASGWEVRTRQTAMQVPGEEQPAIVRVDMREAALGWHAPNSAVIELKISRSHECERGTHECVRHETECVGHEAEGVRHRCHD
jgi:hypothetical protein